MTVVRSAFLISYCYSNACSRKRPQILQDKARKLSKLTRVLVFSVQYINNMLSVLCSCTAIAPLR